MSGPGPARPPAPVPPHAETLAACAVAIDGRAVLIQGAPGSGKSELALVLVDRGARLIADDQSRIWREGEHLLTAPPPTIAGLIEVRNLGLKPMDYISHIPAALLVTLDPEAPRWIESADRTSLADVVLPWVRLFPRTPALAIKVEMALRDHGLKV